MSKVTTAEEAVKHIGDGAVVAVNSSSGLCCPDAVLAALGARFDNEGAPRNLTSVHPIAAGDFFGTKGIDHIAKPGCLKKIVAGSYPSGPTKADPAAIGLDLLVSNDPADRHRKVQLDDVAGSVETCRDEQHDKHCIPHSSNYVEFK